jgi:hypothetical protein
MSLLLDDLRKRRVVRVAIAYLLTAIGLVMAVSLVEAAVGLPDWAVRMVAGTSFVALPFVLVMIWALDDHGPVNVKPLRRR